MIREAELFVQAEQVLVEVVGRIRAEHWRIVMPPLFDAPGTDRPIPLRKYVARYARENAAVPDVLACRPVADAGDRLADELLGANSHAEVTRLSKAARDAVGKVEDGDAIVHTAEGDVTTRDYLWRLDIARCFVAHEIAMHVGSTACPLTEELARGMWEGTEPEAALWRERGVFRDPLPLPPHVSWRDRFMLTAGRDPHPLDH